MKIIRIRMFFVMLIVFATTLVSSCAGAETYSNRTRYNWVQPVGPNGQAVATTYRKETFSVTEGGVTETHEVVKETSRPVQMVRRVYYPRYHQSARIGVGYNMRYGGGYSSYYHNNSGHHQKPKTKVVVVQQPQKVVVIHDRPKHHQGQQQQDCEPTPGHNGGHKGQKGGRSR